MHMPEQLLGMAQMLCLQNNTAALYCMDWSSAMMEAEQLKIA